MKANARRFRALLRPLRNEDGAALVYFGLSLTMLLACFALAVDIGAVLNARSEAQRAADAGALAGAGLFLSVARTPDQSRALAPDTARVFANMNLVGGSAPDSVAVSMVNYPTQWRVRVQVWGRTRSLFSGFIGIDGLTVYAESEAEVAGSATATCVKPFALPDMWQSGTAPDVVYNYPDQAHWTGGYTPARGDRYEKWDGTLTHTTATGFGSPARNGVRNWQNNAYHHDAGRKLIFKTGTRAPDPLDAEEAVSALNPADHMLLDLGSDRSPMPGVAACTGNPVTRNICQCNNTPIGIGGQVQKEPGNISNASSGLQALLDAETRSLSWDNVNRRVVDAHGTPVTESPQIIKVVLYDPTTASTDPNGMLDVVNVALVFIEGKDRPGNNVNFLGRFLQFATGGGAGAGTTTRTLQLVK